MATSFPHSATCACLRARLLQCVVRRWVLVVWGVVASACAVTGPVRMSYRTVDSEAMGRPMQLGVWTPPDWKPGEHLPLFLFLHGGGDDVHCLDDSGISTYLDEE